MNSCVIYPLLVILAVLPSGTWAEEALPAQVEFNRHVRPILSDKCFFCHGPDNQKRKADLRLDIRDEALKMRDGIRAIIPGNPHESESIIRILSHDPDEQMPPPDSKLTLTPREIAILKKWVEQGAEYQAHWAFVPPQRLPLPEVRDKTWPQSGIDHFVLAKLEAEQLTPSPRADKATLLRRVSLDLTGLPPTPAELDAFLADESPDAYEKVVDRLLASPRFGENMAWPWMEAARYADTHGYQADLERTMWPWRDWVINAFNRNLPFDQFTIEQLAGDLLPNATRDQKIATGFNRNHRINGEAGIIPEEYAVEYVVDRVDTTSTIWLGLTAGCARCHDHKFDPLTQKEFFQLYAFFNNVSELGKDGRRGWAVPVVRVPTPEQEARITELTRDIERTQAVVEAQVASTPARLAVWESTKPDASSIIQTALEKDLAGRFFISKEKAGENLATGATKDTKANLRGAAWSTAPSGQDALELAGKTWATIGKLGELDREDHFAFSLWLKPSKKQRMPLLEHEDDLANNRGWHVMLDEEGRVEVQLAYNEENNVIRVITKQSLPVDEWQQVTVSYDGSGEAKGIAIFLDGQRTATKVEQDCLTEPLRPRSAGLRFGGGELRPTLHAAVHDLRFYHREISPIEAAELAGKPALAQVLATSADQRSEAEKVALRDFFLEHHDSEFSKRAAKLDQLRHAFAGLDQQVLKTMVMQDMEKPRPTFILKRGEYDKPGEQVSAAVPAWLGSLPEGSQANRLSFAKWLVSGHHPLTARVAVNRFWQMLFGVGLVKTVEDFGSQGELPIHQDLLDWLAVTFASPKCDSTDSPGLGWDMKALLKLIVTSATYQQSSRVTPELRERDPENRLLARGARFRLPANAIRDYALAVSGLITEKIGGPSVKPYQPAGIWEEISFQRKDVPTDFYKQDTGANLYRRSLYTFWKRTVNPPTMQIFDAAAREACNVKMRVTNTPLQALALLNEVTFLEASRAIAQRMLIEAGTNPADRLRHGWRLVLCREPNERELATVMASVERHRAKFSNESAAIDALLKVGESPVQKGLDRTELAALTAVANTLLNLDEAITKE